jgi:glucose-1-phosphate adenylyltransferase
MEASYIMGADYYQTFEDMRQDVTKGIPRLGIGEGSVIKRAIIDKNARIGSNTRLLNEAGVAVADSPDKAYYIRDGIIIIPKNAVIQDGTVI